MQIFILAGIAPSLVWTGGWTTVPGSINMNDWRWYYSNDFNGPSTAVYYYKWGSDRPNNYGGGQYALALSQKVDFNFNDVTVKKRNSGFLCECP